MTPVQNVAPVPAAAAQPTSAAASATTNTLDYDAFLKLLVAQLQNQDPLEPISETEYVAQLATFSNVEQNIQTNDKLNQMLTLTALGDAEALIGQSIRAANGTSGTVASVLITASGSVATLADGNTIALGEGITVGSETAS